MTIDAGDDARLARTLAVETGRLLVARRAALLADHAPEAAGRAADAQAQTFIATVLAQHRPGDAVLSEEAPDDGARLTADRVWIIDPLDGTREYVRRGRVDWAVHIALWEAGRGLTTGAVALPAVEGVVASDDPAVIPARREPDAPVRVVVSASRTPQVLEALAQAVPLDIVLWGSAGAKAARVIDGDVDAYLHDTLLNEWDAAAPVAVAQQRGLHVSHLDGSPVTFNQATAITGDLLICRPDVADSILEAVGRA